MPNPTVASTTKLTKPINIQCIFIFRSSWVVIEMIRLLVAQQTLQLQRLLPELLIPALPIWLTAHQKLRTNRRIRRVMVVP